MCGLHSYYKHKDKSTGATYFHGVWPLPEYSSVNPLISLFVTINFIDTWIKILDKSITWCCLSYQYNTREIFQKFYISKNQLLKISRENVKLCKLVLVGRGTLMT